MRLNPLRIAGAMVGGVVVLAALATPASAHVTVNPKEVASGEFATLTFRMPNEKDIPSTGLEIVLPEEAPIATARVAPASGWNAEITRRTLDEPITVHGRDVSEAVEKITWTAESEEAGLGPDEFGMFNVSLGPVPDVDEIVFKALQTYADGEIVRWIEVAADGEDSHDLDHPAPVLSVNESAGDGHGGGSGDSADDDSGVTASSARTWGIVGTALGAVALLVAIGAFLRRGGAGKAQPSA